MSYAATLTPSMEAAHRRIEALQKVYDAARKVAAKSEIQDMFPEDSDVQAAFDEAMGGLDAVLWNTAHVLGEPYPFEPEETSPSSKKATP